MRDGSSSYLLARTRLHIKIMVTRKMNYNSFEAHDNMNGRLGFELTYVCVNLQYV